jgi:hypothetical protein
MSLNGTDLMVRSTYEPPSIFPAATRIKVAIKNRPHENSLQIFGDGREGEWIGTWGKTTHW